MTLNVTPYERRGAGKVLRTVTRKLESRSKVYDRAAQIIFRARAYAEKRRDDSIGNPRYESQYTTKREI